MARVHILGEHLVAKDLRAFVRADADLHLTTNGAAARFTLEVRATLPHGSAVSVDTGAKVSATELAVVQHLAQRLKTILVQCGAGLRHEHYVVVNVPADLHEQESFDVAEALYMGLLTAGKVLPKPSRWQRWLARALLATLLLAAAAPIARAQIHQIPPASTGGGSSNYPAVTTATGVITNPADTVTISIAGMGTVGIDVVGAFTGELLLLGKVAGSSDVAVYARRVNGEPWVAGTSQTVTAITAGNKRYLVDVTGLSAFTVYANTVTSGTPTINLTATPIAASRDVFASITNGDVFAGVLDTGGTGIDGALKVHAVDATGAALAPLTDTQLRATAVDINCVSGCGSAPATADGTAFTAGSTTVTPIAAVVDDTATTTVAENAYGAPRMTTNRVLYADLSKTGANTTALKVDGSAVTQPVSGTVTADQGTAGASTASWPTQNGTVAVASTSLDLTVLNSAVTLAGLTGMSTVGFRITAGVLVGGPAQVTFESSFDGVAWNATAWTKIKGTSGVADGVTGTTILSLSSSDAHLIDVPLPAGTTQLRARTSSAVGTGTATVVSAPTAFGHPVGLFVTPTGTTTVTGSVSADTELPASSALGDAGSSTATMPMVGAATMLYDGTSVLQRWRSMSAFSAGTVDSTGVGLGSAGLFGQRDDTTPGTVTENNFSVLRISSNRNLFTTLRDAAGNERGANVNASNQLSVSVDNTPVLGAGTNNIGDVDVLTVPALFTDRTMKTQLTDGTRDGTIKAASTAAAAADTSYVVALSPNSPLGAGTNAIGKLAANSGVDIGDVDVLSVVPGTAATNLGKAEDAGHTSSDTGVMTLGVRKDTATQTTSADADYGAFSMDAYGAQFTRVDHPNRIRCTVTTSTATTITAVGGACATPGAGLSIYITDVMFSASAAGIAADAFPTLKYGTGGTCGTGTTVFWGALTAAAIRTSDNFNTPIKIPANNEVCWISTTAGSKFLVISGYIAP